MSTPEHLHEWRILDRVESCHWFQAEYECECGAKRTIWGEHAAGDSLFWNESGNCPRCAEIEGGADPGWEDTVTPAEP